MRESKSLYEVLGVLPTATPHEIKSAYRKIARKHHPDISGATESNIFDEATRAYEVLLDESRRRDYDANLGLSGINDLADLFKMLHGQRMFELLLRRAPIAPIPGTDALLVHRVKHGVLKNGTTVALHVPDGLPSQGETIALHVPPTERTFVFCRIRGLGHAGTRGGMAGDLWIVVTEKR